MLLNVGVDARGEVAVHSVYILTPRRRGVGSGRDVRQNYTKVGDYRVMVSSTIPLPDGGRVEYQDLVTRGRQPPHSIQTAGGSGAGVRREGLQGGMTCPKRFYQSLFEKECCKTGWAVDICATPSIEGLRGKGIEVTTDNECGIIVGGRAYLLLDEIVDQLARAGCWKSLG